MYKNAFLILSQENSKHIYNFYRDIYNSVGDLGNTITLYHQKYSRIPKWIRRSTVFPFTYDSISKLGYKSIGKSLTPGNNHFPLFEFFLSNTQYDYYWCIEDDVRFSGDWSSFFQTISQYSEYDFVTSHIQRHDINSNWFWWNYLFHPVFSIPLSHRVCSFNPIYRISKRALWHIHECLLLGWAGHHEVLLPSILLKDGFKIGDWGLGKEFTLDKLTHGYYDCDLSLRHSASTVRWRPIMRAMGTRKNTLYHPVKDNQQRFFKK